METIFSKILSGEIPAEKVYENEHVLAFLDAHPVNPGHTLVIPKKWSSGLLDADPEYLRDVITAVQKVAQAVKEATGAEGMNLMQNEGPVAGQKVFHLHFHVIPRHSGDGVEQWHGKPISDEETKAVGEKIRAQLA